MPWCPPSARAPLTLSVGSRTRRCCCRRRSCQCQKGEGTSSSSGLVLAVPVMLELSQQGKVPKEAAYRTGAGWVPAAFSLRDEPG